MTTRISRRRCDSPVPESCSPRSISSSSSLFSPSPPPSSPRTYVADLHRKRDELAKVAASLPTCDTVPTHSTKRVRHLRAEIERILELSSFDPTNPKWANLNDILKLTCTRGRYRWSYVLPTTTTPIPEEEKETPWILAETEEEWLRFEKRREKERKVKAWREGVVQQQQSPLPDAMKTVEIQNNEAQPRSHPQSQQRKLDFRVVKRQSSTKSKTNIRDLNSFSFLPPSFPSQLPSSTPPPNRAKPPPIEKRRMVEEDEGDSNKKPKSVPVTETPKRILPTLTELHASRSRDAKAEKRASPKLKIIRAGVQPTTREQFHEFTPTPTPCPVTVGSKKQLEFMSTPAPRLVTAGSKKQPPALVTAGSSKKQLRQPLTPAQSLPNSPRSVSPVVGRADSNSAHGEEKQSPPTSPPPPPFTLAHRQKDTVDDPPAYSQGESQFAPPFFSGYGLSPYTSLGHGGRTLGGGHGQGYASSIVPSEFTVCLHDDKEADSNGKVKSTMGTAGGTRAGTLASLGSGPPGKGLAIDELGEMMPYNSQMDVEASITRVDRLLGWDVDHVKRTVEEEMRQWIKDD